jgi:ferredoxin like protein
MVVDDLFEFNSFRVHQEPHIRVNQDICSECTHRACTFACPARCYQWNEERKKIDFAYEPCLECGTCLLLCDRGALDWNYPVGGFGVRFRLT